MKYIKSLRSRLAFTLIELLIVVAIIAILAAIAVPNFLEAQTRAKVARVKADLRSLTTALEAYRVDNNNYVPAARGGSSASYDPSWGAPDLIVGGFFDLLSSPVAYTTNAFVIDPFMQMDDNNDRYVRYITFSEGGGAVSYWDSNDYNSYTRGDPWGDAAEKGEKAAWYILSSFGPDMNSDPVEFPAGKSHWRHPHIMFSNDHHPEYAPAFVYDPTNGTKSFGDIFRFGGAIGSGSKSDFWSLLRNASAY
ncbi:MAG: type II secretion system protein [Candidatus Sumerlaeia bacterium]